MSAPSATRHASAGRKGLAALGLSALGIVFGDIGTSPLYTLKSVLNLTGGNPSPEVILGVLSLVLWTLIIITTVKYIILALRVDNEGEGGVLALMALLSRKPRRRPDRSAGVASLCLLRFYRAARSSSLGGAITRKAQRGRSLQSDLFHRARDGRLAQGWQGASVASGGRVLVHVTQFERGDRLLPPAEG